VDNVDDVVSVGQKIQVEITKIDDRGKLSLSPVVADEEGAGGESEPVHASAASEGVEI
jgi:polyribonucleotide nucleotidyltransferase